jgi:outer membrane protein OmpA-like peptidoglycan-associated protein
MPTVERRIEMRAQWILTLIALIFVLGCAGHDRVVLLPDQEGRSGALVVKSTQEETILDKPYKTADVYTNGRVETQTLDAKSVYQQFGQALAVQPPRAASFTLYFLGDSYELTPESKPIMEQIKAELARRPFPEITVIGHTDRVGSVPYNDALSLKRADAVRQILIGAGISPIRIEAAGRGSREMLVPTEEGVSEPRNRRVEISVR